MMLELAPRDLTADVVNPPKLSTAAGYAPSVWRSVVGTAVALGVFGAAALVLGPCQLLLSLDRRGASWLPRLFHRLVCAALGVRTRVEGRRARGRPVLYVCNHVSWLDIFILGAQLPTAFVAKSEVAGWPIVGWLARLQPTLFVVRADRRRAALQAEALAALLRRHGAALVFAEGTSTDGTEVLPFKATLFAALGGVEGLKVQPISLAYAELSGAPVDDGNRARIAWFGDMTLPPHLFGLAGERAITADLVLHPPFDAVETPDRKSLAARCEAAVRAGHDRLLTW